jgi:glycosyltransferase involved in cell wall biosynthesis
MPDQQKPIICFVWDNIGPLHADRCAAVAKKLGSNWRVLGIELGGRSATYNWIPASGANFSKITLFPEMSSKNLHSWSLFWRLFLAIRRSGARHVFLCHYEKTFILLTAVVLRAVGCRVFAMFESKYDDYPRYLWRECLKSLFLLPYQGCLAASIRSQDYVRFLGIKRERIKLGYCTASVERIRHLAGTPPAPDGVPFAERHFTMVARLLARKNIERVLHALAILRDRFGLLRDLVICGDGPLAADLRSLSGQLGLDTQVRFLGFVQTEEVAKVLGSTMALLLVSYEETFGQAVIEAQAMGCPVIVTENCGVRDEFVKSGVNGFVVEADNIEGMAHFMAALCQDEALWRSFAKAALQNEALIDVSRFAHSVSELVEGRPLATP